MLGGAKTFDVEQFQTDFEERLEELRVIFGGNFGERRLTQFVLLVRGTGGAVTGNSERGSNAVGGQNHQRTWQRPRRCESMYKFDPPLRLTSSEA